jgi:pimeloyl-ACP methyl ester carboxylesterase
MVFAYPGFGDAPADETLASLPDLYDALLAVLPSRFHVVAQSMGNVLALRMAIEHPKRVASLVLCAVSGGVDVAARGGEAWRVTLRAAQPSAPTWFIDDESDFTDALGALRIPALVLSGDRDPLSPVAVGEFLCTRMPHAELRVIAGGTHGMAEEEPDRVAPRIADFLVGKE